MISAVQQACTAVTDASLPVQYRGAVYDCRERVERPRGPRGELRQP